MADKPTKRCRSKVPQSLACAALKSPNPKKLRKAAKALRSPASASTLPSSPSILKHGKSRENAVARQLSFASNPSTHPIVAQNPAPKKPGSASEAGRLTHGYLCVALDPLIQQPCLQEPDEKDEKPGKLKKMTHHIEAFMLEA